MRMGSVKRILGFGLVAVVVCFLLLAGETALATEYSPGIIVGTIRDAGNRYPLAGATVTAYDSDAASGDEFIGRTTTDAGGKYQIRIPKRTSRSQWDGPKTDHHTQWRPDIYVVVDMDEYKRFKSKVHSDHELKKNLRIDAQLDALPGARTVRGTVYRQDGKTPLAGAPVTACDADTGGDEWMGVATTDAAGRYEITYRAGSWDGPKTDSHTQWRPDIFVVVTKDNFKRTRSQTFSDQKLAETLTVNVQVEDKPGKVHQKRKNMCEPESAAARCREQGDDYIWLGPENSLGRCTQMRQEVMKAKNIMTAGKPEVWGYVAFFETIEARSPKGVPLDPFVKRTLTGHFSPKVLDEVRVAPSKYTSFGNAMTDCSMIYFPDGQGTGTFDFVMKKEWLFNPEFTKAPNHLHLLLHELTHAQQCYDWGGRVPYADRWFSELPVPVLQDVIQNLDKANMKSIHDHMPMENRAESNADSVMAQLGYKKVPGNWIPPTSAATPPRAARRVAPAPTPSPLSPGQRVMPQPSDAKMGVEQRAVEDQAAPTLNRVPATRPVLEEATPQMRPAIPATDPQVTPRQAVPDVQRSQPVLQIQREAGSQGAVSNAQEDQKEISEEAIRNLR